MPLDLLPLLKSNNNNDEQQRHHQQRKDSNEAQWSTLPSVPLTIIYKYLPSRTDRLSAATVCHAWRLFQLPLSDELKICMNHGDKDVVEKVEFLSRNFICKVRGVVMEVDLRGEECLNAVTDALTLLEMNSHLKELKLRCATAGGFRLRFLEEGDGDCGVVEHLLPSLQKILHQQNLQTFSFFTTTSKILQPLLSSARSKKSLRNLFLYPSNNNTFSDSSKPMPELVGFDRFLFLETLTLPHSTLSDGVLSILGRGSLSGGLKRLSLIAVRPNEDVTSFGWGKFVGNNPQSTVRLTLAGGSGLLSATSSGLIFPLIPLTHLRCLNSKNMQLSFLNAVIGWNLESLECLEVVDPDCDWEELLLLENSSVEEDGEMEMMDPFVYASWRCSKLREVCLGVKYPADSLIGIARLRGSKLVKLEIPKAFIVKSEEEKKRLSYSVVNKEISTALQRDWQPTSSSSSIPTNKFNKKKRCNKNKKKNDVEILADAIERVVVEDEVV